MVDDITDKDFKRLVEKWVHFARMPAWTKREAAALVSGIIPSKSWTHSTISTRQGTFGKELDEKYLQLFDLFSRAEQIRELRFPERQKTVLNWLAQKKIKIPRKLQFAIQSIESPPERPDQLKQIAVSKNAKNLTELSVRERDTLLSIIGTMAVKSYGYNPNKNNKAASNIVSEMDQIGVEPLSCETIRNKLREASELIPQSFFNKQRE